MGGSLTAAPRRMQLGPGLFLTGLTPGLGEAAALRAALRDALADEARLLGATVGGGLFTAAPQLTDLEAGSRRGLRRGAVRLDCWTATLSGTLLDASPERFRLALGAAELETRDGLTILSPAPEAPAAAESLCWLGETVRGLMLIELPDPLSLDGLRFCFAAHGEGRLPFRFTACSAEDSPPFRLCFLEGGLEASDAALG